MVMIAVITIKTAAINRSSPVGVPASQASTHHLAG